METPYNSLHLDEIIDKAGFNNGELDPITLNSGMGCFFENLPDNYMWRSREKAVDILINYKNGISQAKLYSIDSNRLRREVIDFAIERPKAYGEEICMLLKL